MRSSYSQDLYQPVSTCLNTDRRDESIPGGEERMPGTFDSLDLVQDTGVTPSPRVVTPVEEQYQSSLGRRLKTSLGVKISGMVYGEGNCPVVALNISDTNHAVNETGVESNCDDALAETVPIREREADERSLGSESYTTAASSLSSNVCKICHCGEEVRMKKRNFEDEKLTPKFSGRGTQFDNSVPLLWKFKICPPRMLA